MHKAYNNMADNEDDDIQLSDEESSEEKELSRDSREQAGKRIYSHYETILALYGSISDF